MSFQEISSQTVKFECMNTDSGGRTLDIKSQNGLFKQPQ